MNDADLRPVMEELEKAGWSLYKIATRLNLQYIQVQRIKDSGKADYARALQLIALRDEVVPRETLQTVPSSPTSPMRSA